MSQNQDKSLKTNKISAAKETLLKSIIDLEQRINEQVMQIETRFTNELDELRNQISIENEQKKLIEEKYSKLSINYDNLQSLGSETISEINDSIAEIERILSNQKNEGDDENR